MSSNLSSNTLFHYTRRFDNFKKILNDGFRPNYSLENFEFLFEEDTNIANHHFIPMVCFCDIPISSAKEHIKNYGNYAIGLSRKWGEDNGLNPVMYISRNSKINKIFRYAYSSYNELDIEIEKEKNELLEGIKKLKYEDIGEDIINKLSKKNGKKITKQNFEESIKNFVMQCFSEDYLLGNSSSLNATYNDLIYKNGMIKERIHKLLLIANNAIKYVLFIKPFIDKTETIKYYDEKEWRYVPDVSKQFIECPNKVAMEVEKMGKKNSLLFNNEYNWLQRSVRNILKFSSSDIRYIIVRDKMKCKLIDFLKNSSKYRDNYLANNFIVLTISQISEDM